MTQGHSGSIKILELMSNLVKSQKGISLNESLEVAQKEIGQDSWVYLAITGIYSGLLVHVIHLIDSDNKMVKLIIDAGDGKILSKTIWSVKDTETSQNIIYLFTPSIPIPPPMT